MTNEYTIRLRKLHDKQREFVECPARRVIIRAGRRSGKTVGIATYAVQQFLQKRRVLYATPTADQIGKFWYEVQRALRDPLDSGYLYKNETAHIIEVPGTEIRIRAKTAWNAETMRGDYADVLIYDEFQLMNEDAWGVVGAPMLLDNNGVARFIYTPPSLRTAGLSKAKDPRHAAKMFERAQKDESGRWAAFHFTSHDNPHISRAALDEVALDMTDLAYRQEIMAEDVDSAPGALWRRNWIEDNRILRVPDFARVAVGVDPTGSATGDECGIVGGGMATPRRDGIRHLYVTDDVSLHGTSDEWAEAAVALYYKLGADILVAEQNFGGDMVRSVIKTADSEVNVKLVHASRGKAVRAEPVSVAYKQGRGHHVGKFSVLEDELCQWEPGQKSPNRLDALVWLATELIPPDRKRAGAWRPN